MADMIGPFDTAAWSQTEWYTVAPTWAPPGIIGTPAASIGVGDFAVTASGLNVTVACIGDRAWIDGSGYKPDTDKTLAVTANGNLSLSRRDRIVIRRDLAAKTISVVRLAGTPAGTPSAPTLTQTTGGVYELPICSFLVPPNNGTTLSGFVDEREWLSNQPISGKLWRTSGFSSALTDNVFARVGFDASRLSGGFTFDDPADKLMLPAPGFYKLEARGHASGGSGYAASYFVQRQRSGATALDVLVSLGNSKATSQDINPYFSDTLPLLAGDTLLMNVRHDGSSVGTYYGSTEAAGVMLSARWVGPLNGATAI